MERGERREERAEGVAMGGGHASTPFGSSSLKQTLEA
jgi:hypothetical protein